MDSVVEVCYMICLWIKRLRGTLWISAEVNI
jgi:hypothetical protein